MIWGCYIIRVVIVVITIAPPTLQLAQAAPDEEAARTDAARRRALGELRLGLIYYNLL